MLQKIVANCKNNFPLLKDFRFFTNISSGSTPPWVSVFKTHRNVTFMAFLNWGSWHPKSSELRLGQLREFLERHPDKSLFPHKEIGSWRGQDGFGLKEQHLESDSSDARNISNMFERLGGGFRQIFLLWIRLNIKNPLSVCPGPLKNPSRWSFKKSGAVVLKFGDCGIHLEHCSFL